MSFPSLRSPITRAALVAAGLAIAGCGSTQLVNLWRDPDYHAGPMRSVLVVSMRRDPATRRIWEDAFTSALGRVGVDATPSYREFPDRAPAEDRLRRRMEESHYDGILFVRPAGTGVESHVVPGYTTVRPVYWRDPFWRTYGYAYAHVYHPGYVERDRVVRLDISLWTTGGDGQLVWSGTSRTLNPASPADLGDEVSHRVIPELRKVDLL